jgi:hypothetical protein
MSHSIDTDPARENELRDREDSKPLADRSQKSSQMLTKQRLVEWRDWGTRVLGLVNLPAPFFAPQVPAARRHRRKGLGKK